VYNVTVPTDFDRTDLDTYRSQRLADAGFPIGPTLLTGVEMTHARCASAGPVRVLATAGLSNPARLPVSERGDRSDDGGTTAWRPGTVNLIVGTTRALDSGALATLLSTAVEAKSATLLAVTDAAGTTSDAVIVGTDLDGTRAEFTGSATPVGSATRACVRDAVCASLNSRYSGDIPTVETSDHGIVTDRQTDVFRP
jgi:adenosylcobinamide hydrolase